MSDIDSTAVVAEDLIAVLGEYGAYLYHEAKTGSMYIKFPDPRLGSIRVSNHTGRDKYSYRRVVHVNKTGYWETTSHTVLQYHYGIDELNRLIEDVARDWRTRMFRGRARDGWEEDSRE